MAYHSIRTLNRLLARLREPMTLAEALPLIDDLVFHAHPDVPQLLHNTSTALGEHPAQERLNMLAHAYRAIADRYDFTAIGEHELALFYAPGGVQHHRGLVATERLAVVFANPFNNCFVSNAAFAHLLGSLGCDVLILKDPTGGLFLDGADQFSASVEQTGTRIREFAEAHGYRDVVLVGSSGSSYPALLVAAQMGTVHFVGFSTVTNAHPQWPLNASRADIAEAAAKVNQRWRIDLRPLLEQADPGYRRICVYGTKNEYDTIYARHVEGVMGVELCPVDGAGHETMLPSLASGLFFQVFDRVFAAPTEQTAPAAANPVIQAV